MNIIQGGELGMTFIIKVYTEKSDFSGKVLGDKITDVLTSNQKHPGSNNYVCVSSNSKIDGADILIEIRSTKPSGVSHLGIVAREIAELAIIGYPAGSIAMVMIDIDGCSACGRAVAKE